jgi:DNA-binding MarR family transcriptional regulator
MRNADMTAVADAIDRLSMWLRREVRHGVSTSTITTLDTLLANGPMRVSDLAEREAISQPGMTTLINRLEAAGQAERVADPSDGRATLVRITEVGRALLRERHSARTARLHDELQHLDEHDRAALAAAVPAIQRLVERTSQKVPV